MMIRKRRFRGVFAVVAAVRASDVTLELNEETRVTSVHKESNYNVHVALYMLLKMMCLFAEQ